MEIWPRPLIALSLLPPGSKTEEGAWLREGGRLRYAPYRVKAEGPEAEAGLQP